MSLGHLAESYDSYHGLSQRGTEAVAQIQSLTRTGERVERVMVATVFVTADGQRYSAHASVFPSAAYRWRPGQTITILYDRNRPSNNALTLSAARNRVWAGALFVLLASGGLMLGVWIFRDDYWRLGAGIRRRASSLAKAKSPRG
jgi:hypothetical protein